MLKNNKSQIFVFSMLIILLLLVYIYSLETDNFYIGSSGKTNILNNMVYEMCTIAKSSSPVTISQRLGNFSIQVSSFCSTSGNNCDLNFSLLPGMPPGGNMSLLNYTHYYYSVDLNYDGYNISKNFTC